MSIGHTSFISGNTMNDFDYFSVVMKNVDVASDFGISELVQI